MTKDKNEDIKNELEALKKERNEFKEGWQRERAEFLNYKKNEIQRLSDQLKCSNEDLIQDLLSVLDSFDLALGSLKENPDPEMEKGLYLIKSQLENILKSRGVKEISTKHRKFNPELDEAVKEVESDKEPGEILELFQKGYLLFDKVLRPNKVKISKLKLNN